MPAPRLANGSLAALQRAGGRQMEEVRNATAEALKAAFNITKTGWDNKDA
jgi:hypothetical protein